jgi:hypothetical protein
MFVYAGSGVAAQGVCLCVCWEVYGASRVRRAKSHGSQTRRYPNLRSSFRPTRRPLHAPAWLATTRQRRLSKAAFINLGHPSAATDKEAFPPSRRVSWDPRRLVSKSAGLQSPGTRSHVSCLMTRRFSRQLRPGIRIRISSCNSCPCMQDTHAKSRLITSSRVVHASLLVGKCGDDTRADPATWTRQLMKQHGAIFACQRNMMHTLIPNQVETISYAFAITPCMLDHLPYTLPPISLNGQLPRSEHRHQQQ